METANKKFAIGDYLKFAFLGEITFLLIVIMLAYFSTALFNMFPQLLDIIKVIMNGLAQKVGDDTQSGMTVKIFVNNFLITVTPILIFSIQLLPFRLIKALAVSLSLYIGLFLYLFNAVVIGLTFGAMDMMMNVSFTSLLLISLVHGSLELFAMSAGTLFAFYYRYAADQPLIIGSELFYNNLFRGQKLAIVILPLLFAILATAALLEVYVSAPLAAIIVGGA
ncbi:hypothetical protein V6C27_08420 [Peptococcaceae bacterium 1198_IL3148]